MIIGQLIKNPGEAFAITEDFMEDLEDGELIDSAVVTAKDYATLADVSATVLAGSPAIDATQTQVSQMIRAGTHGQTFVVQMRVTTDATPASVYEHEIEVIVRES